MASSSVIGRLLEFVIGFQRMRLHRGVAGPHMIWQRDGDRRRVALLLTMTLKGAAHGVGVRRVALQRLEDGGLQGRGAEPFEQPQQSGGDGAQITAAFGGALEQGLAGGGGLRKAVHAAVLTCRALFVDKSLDVGCVLDLAALA